MGEPIDIKTKKKIYSYKDYRFDKELIFEALEKNLIVHWDIWLKFQQSWVSRAYLKFKDLDKYIILIYLMRDHWQNLSDRFQYLSLEEFYGQEHLILDQINLIKISEALNIPKETIRRKVNELQNEGILTREGKKIVINKEALFILTPEKTLELLSSFIEKQSKLLAGESWFGEATSKKEIQQYFRKFFTIMWMRFYRLQIPFLTRHRNIFRDTETWMVWGNVAMNHQYNFSKLEDENIIRKQRVVSTNNYYENIVKVKMLRGINASSISDISSIPRATVIRKLQWLVSQDLIKKNRRLEYILSYKGKLNKNLERNLQDNRLYVSEFLADIFDYMKNSNFKL